MECAVCGAKINTNSKYCKQCENEISEFGISKKELSLLLEEKGIGKIYQNLISKLNQDCFHEIEIHQSSLDEIDFSEILEEKDGILTVDNLDAVGTVQLVMSCLINEFDAMHNEIGDIMNSMHGDRVAYLNTAYQQYERALQGKNAVNQSVELTKASDNCLKGINMLREEIKGYLNFFETLPKSTIEKLFCGKKLRHAEKNLNLIHDAFRLYCSGCFLALEIDLKNKETEKLIQTARVERDFLNQLQKSRGYCRLLEVDDENEAEWKNKIREMTVNMFFIEKNIDSDVVIIKILEESNE